MVGSKMRSERLFDLILLHIFQPVHSYHKIDVTYFSLFTASVAAHEQHSTYTRVRASKSPGRSFEIILGRLHLTRRHEHLETLLWLIRKRVQTAIVTKEAVFPPRRIEVIRH